MCGVAFLKCLPMYWQGESDLLTAQCTCMHNSIHTQVSIINAWYLLIWWCFVPTSAWVHTVYTSLFWHIFVLHSPYMHLVFLLEVLHAGKALAIVGWVCQGLVLLHPLQLSLYLSVELLELQGVLQLLPSLWRRLKKPREPEETIETHNCLYSVYIGWGVIYHNSATHKRKRFQCPITAQSEGMCVHICKSSTCVQY